MVTGESEESSEGGSPLEKKRAMGPVIYPGEDVQLYREAKYAMEASSRTCMPLVPSGGVPCFTIGLSCDLEASCPHSLIEDAIPDNTLNLQSLLREACSPLSRSKYLPSRKRKIVLETPPSCALDACSKEKGRFPRPVTTAAPSISDPFSLVRTYPSLVRDPARVQSSTITILEEGNFTTRLVVVASYFKRNWFPHRTNGG